MTWHCAIEILDAVLEGARAETALARWDGPIAMRDQKTCAIRDHVFEALRQRTARWVMQGLRTGRS